MTDQNIDTAADTDDVMAEYEAHREADALVTDDVADDAPGDADDAPPADPEPAPEPEASETDKLRKSVQERSRAARQEKQARLAAETALAELRAEVEALKGGKQPAAPSLDDIDPDADPLEAVKRMAAIIKAEQARVAAEASSQKQEQTQRANIEALSSWAAEHEADYREVTPDYDKAADHLKDTRLKELEVITGDKSAAQQAFQNELIGLVAQCRQQNRDPAEVIYTIAQSRGYTKTPVVIDNTKNPLDSVKRGLDASKSLSGGKADASELTIEAINRMPPDKQYAAYEKLKAQELRREQRA